MELNSVRAKCVLADDLYCTPTKIPFAFACWYYSNMIDSSENIH